MFSCVHYMYSDIHTQFPCFFYLAGIILERSCVAILPVLQTFTTNFKTDAWMNEKLPLFNLIKFIDLGLI